MLAQGKGRLSADGYNRPVEELRFLCDAMLGRLARWLRLAGFDTRFEGAAADAELASIARVEGRWLLTRDRRLASIAGPRVVLLRASRVPDQLAEVSARLPLTAGTCRAFSRCPRCNGLLEEAARETVACRVPPYVAAHAGSFRVCRSCGQVYWPGTHVPRIERRLAAVLGAGGGSGGGENEGHG